MSEAVAQFITRWEAPKTRLRVDTQNVASDRLYICDPLDVAKSPLTLSTPVGAFDVLIYQKPSPYPLEAQQLNAFVALEFSPNATVRWEQVEAETPGVVYETDFSAEFGWMAIVDSASRAKILAAAAAVDNAFDDWLAEYLMVDYQNDPLKCRDYAFVSFPEGDGVVVCQSGAGNGYYSAFLGRDVPPSVLGAEVAAHS